MNDFLAFRRMVVPIIIQGIFWIGAVFCVVVGLAALIGSDEGWGRAWGLLVLIAGPFVVRIYCEFLIVVFRINETLGEIRRDIQRVPAPVVGTPTTVCGKCGTENASGSTFCKNCGEKIA